MSFALTPRLAVIALVVSAANGSVISTLRAGWHFYLAPTPWAEAQQSAQPLDGPARRLATHMLSEFFAQPLLDGKPALKLVVDISKTAP
jgi:hypothetical protein